MLKKVLMGVGALVFTLVTFTLVTLLGSVTDADAVGYSDWIEATKVTDPLPGQLYAISGDGEIEGQLCPLERSDFSISRDQLSGRTFVNRLGEAVPLALWLGQQYLQLGQSSEQKFEIAYRLEWRPLEREFAPRSALRVGLQRILDERDMEKIKQHAPAAKVADAERLEACANAILETAHQGVDVCQLAEVISDDTGRTLAVRFAARCLVLDPESDPRPLPELTVGSFWTGVKLSLGLVDQLLTAPVIAGNATG
jgi:hypothetical protein